MLPAVCGSVFPAKSCWDAWVSGIVSWWKVRWIWLMRQNFIAQFIQLWKQCLCDVQLGIVMEENWALSVDQCQLQTLQFSVHLIDLLSILLRCSGFTRKAVVDHTSSRPPNSDHDLFLTQGLPWHLSGKESVHQCKGWKLDLCVGKILWRRKWQPPSECLPGKSHGQWSLVGYSTWDHKSVGHN